MATARAQGTITTPSDIRLQFKTKEGVYNNLKSHRYSKPRGQPLLGRDLSNTHISVVSVKDMQGLSEWIIFNSGRELLCYPFGGIAEPPDLLSTVDKHSYRTSYPLVHDVNKCTRSTEQLDLIVGFNGGPLQHFNPITKSCIAVYNADHYIDATDVTCVRWVPGSETQFVSSHRSGHLYIWTTEYPYKSSNMPSYHIHKRITDTIIQICKPKNRFPLIYRWAIGHGAVQHFDFSPDTDHLAVANQDGFLRIYNFATQEFYGRMRSYYGGFLCVCWSPDGKYVVTGGEDDFISVWSFEEKKVVTRGEGHKSYVNAVAFDPYTSSTDQLQSSLPSATDLESVSIPELKSQRSSRFFPEENRYYRLGSVGQDGMLCFWELSGSNIAVVRRLHVRSRSRLVPRPNSLMQTDEDLPGSQRAVESEKKEVHESNQTESVSGISSNRESTDEIDEDINVEDSLTNPDASIGSNFSKKSEEKESKSKKSKKKKKSNEEVKSEERKDVELQSPTDSSMEALFDGGTESSLIGAKSKGKDKKLKKDKSESGDKHSKNSVRSVVKKKVKNLIGGHSGLSSARRYVSPFETCQSDDIAPDMINVNLIEPLVCKKIWQERLTDIVFREECLLTATQDGYIHVWCRPGFGDKDDIVTNPGLNSPRPGSSDTKHTSV